MEAQDKYVSNEDLRTAATALTGLVDYLIASRRADGGGDRGAKGPLGPLQPQRTSLRTRPLSGRSCRDLSRRPLAGTNRLPLTSRGRFVRSERSAA
jgi:hypothetical protein